MRHLGSIVLSVIFAPVIYVLAGVGMIRLATNGGLVAQNQGTNWTDVGIGVGAVVLAGALYAVLVLARLSPLGPVIASLLYIIAQLWTLFDQSYVTKTLGTSVLGNQGAAEAPLTGLALLLAIPLLVTIFSPRRWRGKDKPLVATYAPPVGQPGFPQPGAQPGFPQPEFPQQEFPQPGVPQPGYAAPGAPQSPAHPSFAQSESSQPTYVQPEPQTYAAPPAAQTYAQPTYVQPAYPQPTSAAPTYAQQLPEPPAPQQTTPENAGDALVDEATVIENRPETTNE
jgi:hypothetical protein